MIKLENYVNERSNIVAQLVITANYVCSINSRLEASVVNTWIETFETYIKLMTDKYVMCEDIDIDGMDWRVIIMKYLKDNPIEVSNLNTPYITPNMLKGLKERGYNPANLSSCLPLMFGARDLLKPKISNYLYIKLETGGLDSYDFDRRILGSRDYPILQVTYAINNNPLKTYIIKHTQDEIANMSPYAIKVHTASGLVYKSMEDGISLEEVIKIMVGEFKAGRIKPNSPIDNEYTMLVGNGTEFILNFMRHQMRNVWSYLSPKGIDVHSATTFAESTGRYDLMFPAVLYQDNPITYLSELREFVKVHNMVSF